MNFLFYADAANSWGERLRRILAEEFQGELPLAPVNSRDQLIRYLKVPALRPDCLVLTATDAGELSELQALGSLLYDIKIVLVLPASGAALVAQAHTLRPRFLTFADSDGKDLIAVLRHMEARSLEGGPGSAPAAASTLFPPDP